MCRVLQMNSQRIKRKGKAGAQRVRCMHQRNGLRNKERVKKDYIILYTPARQRGKISSYIGRRHRHGFPQHCSKILPWPNQLPAMVIFYHSSENVCCSYGCMLINLSIVEHLSCLKQLQLVYVFLAENHTTASVHCAVIY